jgi:copper chaperone CopZ
VTDAVVNFATEKATVTFDESRTDAKKITEAVRATGYDVYE